MPILVVVLSYEYWKTRFNAAPDVAGKTLLITAMLSPFLALRRKA